MENKNLLNLSLYQASHQSGKAIKENFIVRTLEFERIMDSILKDAKAPDDSVQHFLLLGRRGSGKSTLLKRIEYEISVHSRKYNKIIPINLAEEQAGISRLFDLFEVVLRELIDRGFDAEMPEDKLFLDDSSTVARLLFQQIQQALSKSKKRIVLLVDNIDKIFNNIGEDAHILREILLNYSHFKIIGASTRMSEHFWTYDQPFYQFFSIIKLEALSLKEIKKLLRHWSKQYNAPLIATFVKKQPAKIKVIHQLTDGLPRTLKYFIQVLIDDIGLETYGYLQGILDKISPLYQERLNKLSAGQRKIVYNLAFIWEASGTGALAIRCRMKSNEASAFLKQLVDLKIVDKIPTGGRNPLYRLSERFFNLWIVMTQGSPTERRNAKYLTQFLEIWYNREEIKSMAKIHLQKLEKQEGDQVKKLHMSKALVHSKYIDSGSYKNQERFEEAEKFYLKAIDQDQVNAIGSLAIMYYTTNKHKKKAQELSEIFLQHHQDTKGWLVQLFIFLWTGKLKDLTKHLEELLTDESLGQVALHELLVHHQIALVKKIFTTWEKSSDFKQRYLPLYYAFLDLEDNPKTEKERLKIPPEIVETKEEFVASIKERQAFYYPK